MEIPESVKKDIVAFQALQNQLGVLQTELGRIDLEIAAISEAVKALEETEEEYAYKFVGPIMLREKKEVLLSELKERKEALEVRKKAMEKKAKQIQAQLLELKEKIEKELAKVEGVGQGQEVS